MITQTSRFLAREHAGIIEFSSRIIDIFSILLSAGVVTFFFTTEFLSLQDLVQLIFIKILLCLIIFKEANLYRSWRGRPYSDQFSRLTISYIILSVIMFLLWSAMNLKVVMDFEEFLLWVFLSGVFIFIFRAFAYTFIRQLRKKGVNQKKIIIYGAGKLGKSLLDRSLASPESGFFITGFIDDEKIRSAKIKDITVLGGVNQLAKILETNQIDEIWLTLPLKAMDQIERVIEMTSKKNVSVRLIPDLFGLTLLNHSVTEFLGFPVIDLSVNRMVGINRFIKSSEDKVLGFLILLMILPILCLISNLVTLILSHPAFK